LHGESTDDTLQIDIGMEGGNKILAITGVAELFG